MFGNVRLFRNILYTMGEMGLMDSVSINYRIPQLSIDLTGWIHACLSGHWLQLVECLPCDEQSLLQKYLLLLSCSKCLWIISSISMNLFSSDTMIQLRESWDNPNSSDHQVTLSSIPFHSFFLIFTPPRSNPPLHSGCSILSFCPSRHSHSRLTRFTQVHCILEEGQWIPGQVWSPEGFHRWKCTNQGNC